MSIEVLAEEILVRLPVKSLLRLKCVCKEWHKIIKSPIFMREHLNYHRNKPHKILVYDHSDSPDPITLISEDGARENLPSEERVRGMAYLLGSVDGLFLVKTVIDGNISASLWNPATREVRHLPDPNFELPPHNPRPPARSQFGLGLDPVTHDYKVVWFLFFWDAITGTFVVHAAVYSCSRDSWRTLQLDDHYETVIYTSHIMEALGTGYLNGSCYWVERGIKSGILSFHFGNEEFGEIEGPDVACGRSDLFLILLHDDSIALMIRFDIADYEIWVMIQPGLWNKLFAFKLTLGPPPFIMSWFPNTVIYVTKCCRLVSYDVRTGESRPLGFHHPRLRKAFGRNALEGCTILTYKETLVTLKTS